MSLFGSLMGDLNDDPFFGSHMRQMNNMMNSFFGNPFGMMGHNALMGPNTNIPHGRHGHNEMQMTPFGFPSMLPMNMNAMFDINNMGNGGNCHSFMSSSMMTMSSGPDGKPQVYQVTKEERTGPGGIKETKKTVSDSRSGTKKMAIGRHIGERAHIREREKNYRNGDEEEHEEFINLDEDGVEHFNKEWQQRAGRHVMNNAVGSYAHHNDRYPQHRQLALPEPPACSSSSNSRWVPSPRRSIKELTHKPHGSSSNSRARGRASVKSTSVPSSTITSSSNTRKREHAPDTNSSNKRHVAFEKNP